MAVGDESPMAMQSDAINPTTERPARPFRNEQYFLERHRGVPPFQLISARGSRFENATVAKSSYGFDGQAACNGPRHLRRWKPFLRS